MSDTFFPYVSSAAWLVHPAVSNMADSEPALCSVNAATCAGDYVEPFSSSDVTTETRGSLYSVCNISNGSIDEFLKRDPQDYYESFSSELSSTPNQGAKESFCEKTPKRVPNFVSSEGAVTRTPWRVPLTRDPERYIFKDSPCLDLAAGDKEIRADAACDEVRGTLMSVNSSQTTPEGSYAPEDHLITMLEFDEACESRVRAPVADATRRVLRILYGILARAVEDNDSSDWTSVIPEIPIDSACEQLMKFFVRNFPGLLECVPDEEGVIGAFRASHASINSEKGDDAITAHHKRGHVQISKKFDFLRRLADNLERVHECEVEAASVDNEHACLSNSVTQAFDRCFSASNLVTSVFQSRKQCSSSSAARVQHGAEMSDEDVERDIELDGPATARVKELRRCVALKTQEVDELEGRIFSGTLAPNEKLAAERRLKRLERALLNDTIALSVAANSSEFSNEVKKLEGKVTVLSTRQDKVEERLESLEQRVTEDKRDHDRELHKLRTAVDLLLEERQARTENETRLQQVVENIQQEQRQTRKTVDIIDNNSANRA